MQRPVVRPRHPLLRGLQWVTFAGCVLILGWIVLASRGSEPPSRLHLVSILLGSALVLGTASPLLGDRHPRLRWTLLIASGALLVAVFWLERQLITS